MAGTLYHEPVPNPEMIQYVIGYRVFRLLVPPAVEEDQQGLYSLARRTRWDAGENHAICLPNGLLAAQSVARYTASEACWAEAQHAAPDPECECGMYGVYSLLDALSAATGATAWGRMVGAIKMWGRAEAHASGLRSEYAEIIALAGGEESGELMASVYGVPWFKSDVEAMEQYALTQGVKLPEEFIPEKPNYDSITHHYVMSAKAAATAVTQPQFYATPLYSGKPYRPPPSRKAKFLAAALIWGVFPMMAGIGLGELINWLS